MCWFVRCVGSELQELQIISKVLRVPFLDAGPELEIEFRSHVGCVFVRRLGK